MNTATAPTTWAGLRAEERTARRTPPPPAPPSATTQEDIDAVIDLTAEALRVTREELAGTARPFRISWARQVAAMMLVQEALLTPGEATQALGRSLGYADHAIKHVRDILDTEPRTRAQIEALRQKIRARLTE